MRFLLNYERDFKNGLYLDYFYKNIIFFFYKKCVGNNFIYLVDKYLAEKIFFFFKTFFSYLYLFINTIKFLNFNQLLKLSLILFLQLLLMFLL